MHATRVATNVLKRTSRYIPKYPLKLSSAFSVSSLQLAEKPRTQKHRFPTPPSPAPQTFPSWEEDDTFKYETLQEPKTTDHHSRLFVVGLPEDTLFEEVEQYFQPWGKVVGMTSPRQGDKLRKDTRVDLPTFANISFEDPSVRDILIHVQQKEPFVFRNHRIVFSVQNKAKPEQPNLVIQVSNLPFNTTEASIQEYFTQHGDIADVRLLNRSIVQNPEGTFTGIAAVTFKNLLDVTVFLQKHHANPLSFMNRRLYVQTAQRKQTDSTLPHYKLFFVKAKSLDQVKTLIGPDLAKEITKTQIFKETPKNVYACLWFNSVQSATNANEIINASRSPVTSWMKQNWSRTDDIMRAPPALRKSIRSQRTEKGLANRQRKLKEVSEGEGDDAVSVQ
ncbi:hypothetical protein DL96DRAFT_120832 [Flagelloscypha sp. PMI_526]|nr:hypothetical protein DL96DRAFT_120832 [Flagelloscypha sp. PMI_526]